MVLLAQTPPPMRWRQRLLGYLPGAAVGLGLAVLLRSTELNPGAKIFIASLPMWFLFTLVSELGGPSHPWPSRLLRSGAYAVLVSGLLAGIMWVGE